MSFPICFVLKFKQVNSFRFDFKVPLTRSANVGAFCDMFKKRILYTIPNGHNPEWTQFRMDTILNGHNPEWTPSRKDTIPNGHNPEWTQSRMDTFPNGHNPEWTQSRMGTIPNGHNPERTQSRMDTIPNGHNPEWTQSRMSTYHSIARLFYSSFYLKYVKYTIPLSRQSG